MGTIDAALCIHEKWSSCLHYNARRSDLAHNTQAALAEAKSVLIFSITDKIKRALDLGLMFAVGITLSLEDGAPVFLGRRGLLLVLKNSIMGGVAV